MKRKIREMLIRESKEYLRGYHINLSKYKASILQDDEDDVTAVVMYTSKISGARIYVGPCYYNDTEILQAGVYL